MAELNLVTTEQFNSLDCNFYRNMNNDILVTREQIGTALEYSDPIRNISKIHNRHKERLDKFSVVSKLTTTDGKAYNTYLYNIKGIMELCRWSNSKKANQFIDFTWEVMEKILTKQNQHQQEIPESVIDQISILQEQIEQLQNKPKTRNTRWISKTFEKCKLIAEHLDISLNKVLRDLYTEIEDTYDLDLSEYTKEYSIVHNTPQPYMLQVIDDNKNLKLMCDCTLNNILEQYELVLEKRETIFNQV
jgi:hypothetical protein